MSESEHDSENEDEAAALTVSDSHWMVVRAEKESSRASSLF